MAKTSNSAGSPYASPADFLARVDNNLVSDLAVDDGTNPTVLQLQTNVRIATALASASGEVESVALQGGRYSPQDLQALTGNSAQLLKDIVSGIAIERLRAVRGITDPNKHPLYERAMAFLESLGEGKSIFAFAETEAAGLPSTYQMQPSDYFRMRPLMTNQYSYWGIRNNRRGGPADTGGYCGF